MVSCPGENACTGILASLSHNDDFAGRRRATPRAPSIYYALRETGVPKTIINIDAPCSPMVSNYNRCF